MARHKKKPSPGRHIRRCGICLSVFRAEIERDYLDWESIAAICKLYKIPARSSLYIHVRALGLDQKRDGNIRRALARFIERGATVRPTASAFVSAIGILSKLNAEGKWIDTIQHGAGGNPLFERMSRAELLRFAECGALPNWVTPEERQSLS